MSAAKTMDRPSARPACGDAAEVIPQTVQRLFESRGWSPLEFQRAAWAAYLEGRSGLIHAPTGLGKTWSAWLGPVIEGLREPTGGRRSRTVEPIRVLWITPLRALAADTVASLQEPIQELGLNWSVQMRTGDTSQSVKRKQKEKLPTALVTTPESLTLLLSYPGARERFASLRCIVADEWHELMGSKRGVQAELAFARLRAIVPGVRTWGLSATLGNLEQARDVLLGAGGSEGVMVRGDARKALEIRTIIPSDIERFPWAGHLGTRSVAQVIEAIRAANSTLLFTNTRSQAELWFARLLHEAPDLLGSVAIHHGSLDRSLRAKVEAMLGGGNLKCVVCTSSLDLGVDFAPVDQVLQVGSPKGVGRVIQRAGRSGHRPGATSRVLGVPAHAFELVEFAAVRDAAASGNIEPRQPIEKPLDVLVQHLVTVACGDGFVEDELRREVMSTHAYWALTDEEWGWAMDFVRRGGPALGAYPHFARVTQNAEDRWVVGDAKLARTHRMTIGTITGESSMTVKYTSGRTLGHIEEGFIGRLTAGSRFVFAGRVLEILRVREMTVYVARARNKSGIVPRWDGGRFSLSTQLAEGVRRKLDEAAAGRFDGPEMEAVRPLLELQKRWSIIPKPDELLIEEFRVGKVHSVFLFPFQGRAAHEGMGALLAYRLSQRSPATITSVANDYGIGLRSDSPMTLKTEEWREVLTGVGLLDDLAACLNAANFARRQFRDIARIAGLIMPGFPGTQKPMRHIQASSEMFFDVFREFDPGNLLLDQARREVLSNQFEIVRLRRAMDAAASMRITVVAPRGLTPLAFPIWAEDLRATTLSSERWADMVRKMVLVLEDRAGDGGPVVTVKERRRDRRAVGR